MGINFVLCRRTHASTACQAAYYGLNRFSSSEFDTTDTELNAMAAAAMIGFRLMPNQGMRMPAAMGMPITL